MLGRRGDIELFSDVILGIAFLAPVAVVMFLFIDTNAVGEPFHARFNAIDIGTLSDVANAPQGDVLIRYDNLRHDLNLRYWFGNGEVSVGRPVEDGDPALSVDAADLARSYYGLSPEYLWAGSYHKPRYLVLRKLGDTYAITDVEIAMETCPAIGRRAIPVDESAVHIEAHGDLTPSEQSRLVNAFKEVFEGSRVGIAGSKTDANILIGIGHVQGSGNSIDVRPTIDDGRRLACLFSKHLEIVSQIEGIEFHEPLRQEGEFVLNVTVTTGNEVVLSPEHLGRSMAYALARYYR